MNSPTDSPVMISALRTMHAISSSLAEEIALYANQIFTLKGEIIQRSERVATDCWFIESGVFRSYKFLPNGSQVTQWFWQPGEFIIPVINPFSPVTPESIESLSAGTIRSLNINLIESWCSRYPEAAGIRRLVIGKYIDDRNAHTENLLLKTSKTNYHLLVRNKPDIILQSSQQHIASFLKITPEQLSRIRKSG